MPLDFAEKNIFEREGDEELAWSDGKFEQKIEKEIWNGVAPLLPNAFNVLVDVETRKGRKGARTVEVEICFTDGPEEQTAVDVVRKALSEAAGLPKITKLKVGRIGLSPWGWECVVGDAMENAIAGSAGGRNGSVPVPRIPEGYYTLSEILGEKLRALFVRTWTGRPAGRLSAIHGRPGARRIPVPHLADPGRRILLLHHHLGRWADGRRYVRADRGAEGAVRPAGHPAEPEGDLGDGGQRAAGGQHYGESEEVSGSRKGEKGARGTAGEAALGGEDRGHEPRILPCFPGEEASRLEWEEILSRCRPEAEQGESLFPCRRTSTEGGSGRCSWYDRPGLDGKVCLRPGRFSHSGSLSEKDEKNAISDFPQRFCQRGVGVIGSREALCFLLQKGVGIPGERGDLMQGKAAFPKTTTRSPRFSDSFGTARSRSSNSSGNRGAGDGFRCRHARACRRVRRYRGRSDGASERLFGVRGIQQQFGKPDYYDENGVARLHFWETRYYPKDRREKVYASAEVVPFTVVTEGSRSEAYEDFRREGGGKKYIDWLEEKYAETKKALSSAKTKKA